VAVCSTEVEWAAFDAVFTISLMPWACPICNNTLRASETEPRPLPHTRHRCPVCGFELEWDEFTDSLVLTRLLDSDHQRRGQIH